MKNIRNAISTINFLLRLPEAVKVYQSADLSQIDSTEDEIIELEGSDTVKEPELSNTDLFMLSVVVGASHQESQSRGLEGSLQLGGKSDRLDLGQDSSRDIVSYESDTGNNQLQLASLYHVLVAFEMAASTSQIMKKNEDSGGLLLGSEDLAIEMESAVSGEMRRKEDSDGLQLDTKRQDLVEDTSHDTRDEELEVFEGSKSNAVADDWSLIINIAILGGFLKSLLQAVGFRSDRYVANERGLEDEKPEFDQGVSEYTDKKSEIILGKNEYADENKEIGQVANEYIYKVLRCLQNVVVQLISREEDSYVDGKITGKMRSNEALMGAAASPRSSVGRGGEIIDRPQRREGLLEAEGSAGSIVGRGERDVVIGYGVADFLKGISNAVLSIVVDGPKDRQIFTVDIGKLGRALNLSSGVTNLPDEIGQSIGNRKIFHGHNSDLLMKGNIQRLTGGAAEGPGAIQINNFLKTITGVEEIDSKLGNVEIADSQRGQPEVFQPTVVSGQSILGKDSQVDHRVPSQEVPREVPREVSHKVHQGVGGYDGVRMRVDQSGTDKINVAPHQSTSESIGPSREIGSAGQNKGDSNRDLEKGQRPDNGKHEEWKKKKSSGWSGSWRSFGSRCMRIFLRALSVAAECWKKVKEWAQKNTKNKVDPRESFSGDVKGKFDSTNSPTGRPKSSL